MSRECHADVCVICGNTPGNRRLVAREKMVGTLEAFEYAQCAACGHLWRVTPVEDMGRYYGQGYYSFHAQALPAWRKWLYRVRTRAVLQAGDGLGRLLAALKPPYYAYWLGKTGLQPGQRLLDVGSGAGVLIRILQCTGLQCTGIDPFMPEDVRTPEGVELRRADLLQETNMYHAVLFNHSFEHVPNPREMLQKAATLLKAGGCVVVRMPLADSFSFFHYGADWIQWDAPRHQHLFTKKSFALLADDAGLHVDELIVDSSKMQFWASEEYQRNIFHQSKESFGHNPNQTHFTKKQIRSFEQWATWLNQMGAGDQATFICRRKTSPGKQAEGMAS